MFSIIIKKGEANVKTIYRNGDWLNSWYQVKEFYTTLSH